MEKSIENIWNQGFLDEGALVVPKINKLYEVKSINTIDKFQSIYRKNYWFLWLLLAVNFIGGSLMVNVYLGLYMAVLFIPMLVLSKKQIKRMDSIDANESSYHYLESFNDWLQKMIDDFRWVYQFFYPLYFIGMVWFLGMMDTGEDGEYIPMANRILESDQVYKIEGIPVIWVGSILLLTAVIAYFSRKIYMFDIRLVYGRLMDRLANMLKEMDELRR
jgi:hypothetical protein